MSGVQLSQKHGVNPTMGICFFCGKPDGTIGLLGKLPGDVEAPRYALLGMDPCPACVKLMETCILLVKVTEDDEGRPVPAGHLVGVREDALRRVVSTPALLDQILEKRCALLPADVWHRLGLDNVQEISPPDAAASAATDPPVDGGLS
jgi:hypothetical protein